MNKLCFTDSRVLMDEKTFNEYLSRTSEYRRSKILSYKFKKDRNLSLAATILIDKYLNEIGLEEKDIVYEFGEYGKPYIPSLINLHFSISHSGYLAAVAFSDKETGCDIEQITRLDNKVKLMCLNSLEQKDKLSDEEFFKLWTMKESYLKAKGIGLYEDLKNITAETVESQYCFSSYILPDNYILSACFNKEENTVCPQQVYIQKHS